MSINTIMSQIKRLENDIANLNKKLVKEQDNEAKAIDKIAKAQKRLMSAKTTTTLKSSQRDLQNANNAQQKAKDEQAKLAKQIAGKAKSLSTKQSDLSKAQAKERESHQKELEKLRKESITIQAAQVKAQLEDINKSTFEEKEYDVFISHASEDKDSFVEPLARAMQEAGIRTWYDSDQIAWGQSIRQTIDKGLIKSKFCMIILSQNFLDKYWTNYELNGIFQKDSNTLNSIILPIWHNITRDEIQKRNLMLTDMLALNTSIHSTKEIVDAMLNLLTPVKENVDLEEGLEEFSS
ncbi:TIR domain-containing protein [Priestia megaterium]|uniref:TIR domain-containing protein n=1 Tax=Priestia megaterium TaxID=1404 RepID=UPI001A93B2FC|nr:TIR domain-containing protein [Priestia megaterium]QSX23452.1 TIR domain-containing protein [Priestia megaterium]